MTDHAQTVGYWISSAPVEVVWLADHPRDEALEAMGAIVAERQQAIDDAKHWQQAQEELERQKIAYGKQHDEWFKVSLERQQAIDALRDIADTQRHKRFDDRYSAEALKLPYEIARAALLNLGEQP